MITAIIISGLLIILGNLAYTLIDYYITGSNEKDTFEHCSCYANKVEYYFLSSLFGYYSHNNICLHHNKKNLFLFYTLQLATISYGWLILATRQNQLLFLFIYLLLCIALIDLNNYVIPNVFVIILFIAALYKNLTLNENLFLNISVSLIIALSLTLINLLAGKAWKKDSIGYGDIKLLFVLNLFGGYQVFTFGLWLSALIAIPGYYLITSLSKKHVKVKRIPFGFFLGIIFSVIFFFDRYFINLYYKWVGV